MRKPPSLELPEDPREVARILRQWRADQEQEQWQALVGGESALTVAAEVARSREELLRTLFVRATVGSSGAPAVALVALGGLGRGELAPFSDIDVVLLTEASERDQVQGVVDGILYPLWDAGFDVGHALRSPKEFARMAKSDLTIRTSALDWKPVAGAAPLFESLERRLHHLRRSRGGRRTVLAAIEEWMEGAETSTVFRLEPNVKTDPGGLRTLHHTWWSARVTWGITHLRDLLYRGKTSDHDYTILTRGREFMQGLRLALHHQTGRRQDVLRFDIQDAVGELLGFFAPDSHRGAGDALLAAYYHHAKALKAAATRIQERCAQELSRSLHRGWVKSDRKILEGFELVHHRLAAQNVSSFERDPLEMLRIFRVAQRHGERVAPETRMTIARLLPDYFTVEVGQSPEAVKLWLDILTDPRGGDRFLGALHELGFFERFIPEFQAVTGLVQRDMYHVYTVDAHLIYCAQMILHALSEDPKGVPDDVVVAASHVQRPHVLVLAGLLHDIGKGHGHGHSERGAQIAREVASRMCWKREDTVDLSFLVEVHLSMMIISQRRDLEDQELIDRFADRVESTERLNLLYVLSWADAVTTGPEAYTSWKAALLRELYHRTRGALREGAGRSGISRRAQERLEALLERAGPRREEFHHFALQLSPRHLLTHRYELILRHMELVALAGEEGAAARAFFNEPRGDWEIVVASPDGPGLLADLTGVLSASGVSVTAAYTGATTSGTALCTFVAALERWPSEDVTPALGDLYERLVHAALKQTVNLKDLHRRRAAARSFSPRVPVSKTRVLFDRDASVQSTVLDVFTPDRVGVLHVIAKEIYRCGLMIEQARITTEGERAVDSFYVVDALTRAPLSESQEEHLAQRIEAGCTAALKALDR